MGASGAGRANRPYSFAVMGGLATSALVIVASLGGILSPPTYARETASLAAQGIGQDWVNLMAIAPFLAFTALMARRGSRRALFLLGGGYAYTAYSFAIYAFGVHFNSFFLVYCAALGVSVFGLASVAGTALREDVRGWYVGPLPRRFAAWVQIAIALIFAMLWLVDIVPALLQGRPPMSVAQDNLITNPVHVLDLSLALPALVLSGIALLRDEPLGYCLSPMLLTLGFLMALAIGGMVVAVFVYGIATDLTVAVAFAFVAAVCATATLLMLRCVPPAAES